MENYYRWQGCEGSPSSTPINLKLVFSNEVASPVFTKENITGKATSDGENSIKVILVDSNTQQQITTGQVASARVKLVLLRGNFGHVSSSLEFKKNIVVEWSKKKNLLLGDLYVDLKHGCGTVGGIRIKHDKNPISNAKFRLGAMVDDCPFIKEAITGPFDVKDHRNAPKSLRPLSLEDNVGQLMNISRKGRIRKRLESNNVWIVKDFLDRHSSNAQELKKICGIKAEKTWKKTVDHAKTCLIKNVCNTSTQVKSTYHQSNTVLPHDYDGSNGFANCYKPKPHDNDVLGCPMIMDDNFSITEVEQSYDMWFACQGYQENGMIGASACMESKCVKAKKIWMKLRTILWFSIAFFMKKDGSCVGVTM